jgi:hypothetical protein
MLAIGSGRRVRHADSGADFYGRQLGPERQRDNTAYGSDHKNNC